MNEKAFELAIKLGTTADHLWGVLIKQAPISGISDIIIFLITLFLVWPMARVSFNVCLLTVDSLGYVFIGLIFIVWIISFCWQVSSFGNIFAAFYNPEYWALNYLLNR